MPRLVNWTLASRPSIASNSQAPSGRRRYSVNGGFALEDLDDLLNAFDALLVAALAVAGAPAVELGGGDDLEDRARQAGAPDQKVGNAGGSTLLVDGRGAAADLELAGMAAHTRVSDAGQIGHDLAVQRGGSGVGDDLPIDEFIAPGVAEHVLVGAEEFLRGPGCLDAVELSHPVSMGMMLSRASMTISVSRSKDEA